VRKRAALGRRFVAEALAPVAAIARALLVSRQSLYLTQKRPDGPVREKPRLVPPVLPENWSELVLSPLSLVVEVALHILARRHPAAGYRKLTSRLRRAGYVVNRKKVARLLSAWGFSRRPRRPHPKRQGRPFHITRPNQLWQTDLTSLWCGEDGWCYFTAVIDCFDRSVLGFVLTRRCRTKDVSPAVAKAFSATWPHGIDATEVGVTLRHDNGSQFTSERFLTDSRELGITLSRTAYRHPDGNAFVERLYRTYKEECVWPNEFSCYEEALAATAAWVHDYNHHRPHDSLGRDTTPAECRQRALDEHKTAA
jgi:putative transposase